MTTTSHGTYMKEALRLSSMLDEKFFTLSKKLDDLQGYVPQGKPAANKFENIEQVVKHCEKRRDQIKSMEDEIRELSSSGQKSLTEIQNICKDVGITDINVRGPVSAFDSEGTEHEWGDKP